MSTLRNEYSSRTPLQDRHEPRHAYRLPDATPQSRCGSAIETASSTAVGFLVATAANWYVLPLWGLHPSVGQSAAIGVVFTAISLVRSYLFRRAFEWLRVYGVVP